MGWLLVLGLKEDLVECATVCVKSEVILLYMYIILTPSWLLLRDTVQMVVPISQKSTESLSLPLLMGYL